MAHMGRLWRLSPHVGRWNAVRAHFSLPRALFSFQTQLIASFAFLSSGAVKRSVCWLRFVRYQNIYTYSSRISNVLHNSRTAFSRFSSLSHR
jgi:hypothetical protein